MKYTAFYIIRPKKVLINRIMAWADSPIFLSEPVLWTKEQGGRSAWALEDHVKAVKYFFLAYIKNSLLTNEIEKKLFGGFSVSTDFFDSWWELELFDGFDETVEDIVDELRSSGALKDLSHVENPVVTGLIDRERMVKS